MKKKKKDLRAWLLMLIALVLVPTFSTALIGLGLLVGIIGAWSMRGLTKL